LKTQQRDSTKNSKENTDSVSPTTHTVNMV